MIAIIDYDAGNLASVARAVTHLGYACTVTHDAREIRRADRIIFPGVGAAGAAMSSLRRTGLDAVLKEQFAAGKPIMGICLGTQVIMSHSEENDTICLGMLAGQVKLFPVPFEIASGQKLKIPHMGWNGIRIGRSHPLFAGLEPEDEFYFVHSYYPMPDDPDCVLATSDYGIVFASVIGYRNLAATQFHLEKSGRPGLRMLKNFCTWIPSA
ncbi:MAG: imidazole glycerol phosphate synthase subunit HisH [Hyphomicrobiales bacterium]